MDEDFDMIWVSDQPEQADRRSAVRRKVLKGAVIHFNKGYSASECLARNISETGAKLIFGDPFGIPGQFDLVISGSESRRAEVKWRKGTAIGVAFVAASTH